MELDQINVHVQVAMVSRYLMQLHQGHLKAIFHVFAYLQKYKQSKLVFHDRCVSWGNKLQGADWRDFYFDANKPIPPNFPDPCGKCRQ